MYTPLDHIARDEIRKSKKQARDLIVKRALLTLRLLFLFVGSLFVVLYPPTAGLMVLFIGSFFLRTFGWEAGYHRYFAHRSFRTSRTFQLVLACLGAMSGQRGPLWWASVHREHHHFSDTTLDPHSPVVNSRLFAYLGWLYEKNNEETNFEYVKDWLDFPELLWINDNHAVFPYVYLAALFIVGQWTPLFGGESGVAAVIWGFCLSTLLSIQGTHLVNAFAHSKKSGWFTYRRYNTDDYSQNHWLLCLITLGASWHNNHHRFPVASRAGFQWWELDIAYLTLRGLALFGLVWDLREVPYHVRTESTCPTSALD